MTEALENEARRTITPSASILVLLQGINASTLLIANETLDPTLYRSKESWLLAAFDIQVCFKTVFFYLHSSFKKCKSNWNINSYNTDNTCNSFNLNELS